MINNIRLIFKCLFLTVTLGFVLGCSGNSSCPAPNSKEIFISTKGKGDVPIEDIFSEHRYIPLETRDDLLLPDISEIRRVTLSDDGQHIFISDRNSVMRFHLDGRFDRRYRHQGEGPEDYFGIWSFTLWKNGDISIFDMYHKAILTYSEEDSFISRFRYPEWDMFNMISLDDSLLLIRCTDLKKDDYLFHVINRNTGMEESAYWKLEKPDKVFAYMLDYFYRYGEKILLNRYKSNDIHELTRDSAILRYRINIDNKIPPEGYWRQENKDIFETYRLIDDYIGHIPFFMESDRSILLRYDGGAKERQGYAFVDKATRESRAIVRFIFEDGFVHQPEYFFPLSDGWCAMLLYPEDIFKNTVFAQRFPGLDEESNPVLFLGKLR